MLKIYAVETSYADRHKAARTLLQWKYEELWRSPLPALALTEQGKPYFANGQGYFSLSYTDGWAFCALSDSPVGLDVEKVRPISPNAVRGVLTREEWMQYSLASNPAQCFMQFWTLKEAFLKFTGEGIAPSRLRELSFDLTYKNPILRGKDGFYFINRCAGDLVISLCLDNYQIPEFYKETL